MFLKIIVVLVTTIFIVTNATAGYAAMDKLKPRATKDDSRLEEIKNDLGKPKSLGNPIPIIDFYQKNALQGKRVLLRVDFNVSDEKGNIKDVERLVQAIPTIVYLMQNGATVILTSHNGRPGGKVKMEFSLGPVANRLRELLKEEGIRVVFHPESINEQGLKAGLKEDIIEDAINVLENTRFYAGEEKNEEAFAKALAELADNYMYVFDAFGTGERVHASTGGAAKYMDKVAIGFLVQKEYEYLEGAAGSLYGLIIGGGPKVSEKVPVVKNVIKNIQEGGFIIIGTGPLPAFLKEVYGIEIGQKYTEEDLANAKEILRFAQEKNIRVILPIDFIAVDKNLAELSDDGKKTWLQRREIPKDATFYYLTLEELKKGSFVDSRTAEEKKLSLEKLFIYDIGTASALDFGEAIHGTAADLAIFWNGTVGVNEIPRFEEGSRKLGEALVEATSRGVITAVGGGDTIAAVAQYGFTKGLTHVSTGGGASLALLQGKKLAVIAELENIEIQKFQNADKTTYIATGGEAFSEYIKKLGDYLRAMPPEYRERALIVTPEVFRISGINNALKELEGLSNVIKVALYGEKAEKLKIWIGNEDIVTAKSLEALLQELTKKGIGPGDTLVFSTPQEKIEETKLREMKINKQIVSGDIATLAVAKAVKELLSDAHVYREFFSEFLLKIIRVQVIESISKENRQKIIEKLGEGTFVFPEEVKVTKRVDEDTKKARLITEEFMDRV